MWTNMMNGQGWNGMGMGMGIGMVIFWILVIILIVALLRRVLGADRDKRQAKSALEILRERYASGEINKDEYEQKKHDLGD
ncbi:MAG: putative membrane protein [Motiliproteus sp.]|jgi:putative membrane protein